MKDLQAQPRSLTAFEGDRLVGSGPLPSVLRAVKQRVDAAQHQAVLILDDETGEPVDFDFRGSIDEVIARAQPSRPQAGPGRPKLGVLSREVSLLPHQWEWLERQPSSISATLRRLVE